ncbi:putative integral membrane protein [Babesia bovis T2Bo]|uniref:Membrane protein, putative n=1 Tax=Babesia bovis TaxID=5865 RepID=A7AN57_BABBO|nr:putative integral membrane protein [Babesia bovis T2Bo]EDO07991.1 putative integral membrane protein [Babesia bovis T2Bo]|eukprot:XP_001611559.1 membrane protein [Babesia bovis T2Bo]
MKNTVFVAAIAAQALMGVFSVAIKMIDVDISVEKGTNYMRRKDSDDSFTIVPTNDFCIGNVLNNGVLISDYPSNGITSRTVSVHRYKNTDPWTGTVKPFVDDTGCIEIIDIETRLHKLPIRQRFVMNETRNYETVTYTLFDMDICASDFDDFVKETPKLPGTSANAEIYHAPAFKRIGAIKCGDRVLLESDDYIFTRYAQRSNNTWEITTIPVVGRAFKNSFLPVAWDDCPYRIIDKGSAFLDLSSNYEQKYADIVVSCGENCVFFDGCSNPSNRIVDVVDNNGVIYMGVKSQCLDVKLRFLEKDRYLAIYSKRVDGNFETLIYRSEGGKPFLPYKPVGINIELTDERIDDMIRVVQDGDAKQYSVRAPHNLKYTIGAVSYKGNVLVGRAFLERPENVPYVVIERTVTFENGFTTIDTATDKNPSSQIVYVTNDEGVWTYTSKPVEVELSRLNTKDPNFKVTKSNEGEYHIETLDRYKKIGTVKYKDRVVHHAHQGVTKTELWYRNGEISVISHFNEDTVLHTRYRFIQGFIGNDHRMFVEQFKEPLTLQLDQLFVGHLPEYFCTESQGKFLKISVCQDVFGQVMGEVNFFDQTVVSTHRFYKYREVFVGSDFFLSTVLVKSVTEDGTTVVETFLTYPANGSIVFVRHNKKPIAIDISPTASVHTAISRTQDDHHLYYTIKPEYAIGYCIGDVLYRGHTVMRGKEMMSSRRVTVRIDYDESNTKKVFVHIADVDNFDHRSHSYSGDTELTTITKVPRKPVDVDISFRGVRSPQVAIGIASDTMSFYIPWCQSSEYTLANVYCTGSNGTVETIYKDLSIDEMPEVRVRGLNNGARAVVSITPKNSVWMHSDVRISNNGTLTVKETTNHKADGLFTSFYGEL